MDTTLRLAPIMLVVDGASDDLRVLFTRLRDAGLENPTTVVESAEVARVFIEFTTHEFSPVPDLVVIDVTVPHLRGMDLYQSLRLRRAFVDVPVVLLCSPGDAPTRRTQVSGPTCWLEKYPAPEVLRKVVAGLRSPPAAVKG